MMMERIIVHYSLMECWRAGLYNAVSQKAKRRHIDAVVRLFTSKEKTERAMRRVIDEWPNSTTFYLSNTSINRVAWLGQAACCITSGTPRFVTMEAWWHVPKESRDMADAIAESVILEYEKTLCHAKDRTWTKCA